MAGNSLLTIEVAKGSNYVSLREEIGDLITWYEKGEKEEGSQERLADGGMPFAIRVPWI